MDFNESNLAWNKSISAPDISSTGPLFRRVIIEERYFPNNHQFTSFSSPLSPGLLSTPRRATRQFSCEQLTGYPSIENNSFQSTNSTITSTPVPVLEIEQLRYDSPMDVDQCDSTDTMAIETGTAEIKTEPTILDQIDLTFRGSMPILKKKRSNPRKSTTSNKNSSSSTNEIMEPPRNYFKLNLAILISVMIAVPIYDKLNYNRTIDIDGFTNDLSKLVIGQEDAVLHINNALYQFSNGFNNPERHLLALIGPTGVGKSLCSNIIKRKFKPKQIHEVDIDKFDFDQDYINLYKSVPYLIILDDLVNEEMPKVVKFLELLPENKWILVVTIFNIQETEDVKTFTINNELYETIPLELSQLSFNFEVAKFQRFDLELIQSNYYESFYNVYFDFVSNIPNWQQVISKHNFEIFGFKGLFEKMNLLSK